MNSQFFGKARFLIFVTGLVLTLGLSTSCTRKSDSDITQVKMALDPSLSKPGALGKVNVPSGYYPMHMIANLHYDGNTVVDEWDCKETQRQSSATGTSDDGDIDYSQCNFPSSINFHGRSFPRGSNRIIQVLLVYASEEERLYFAYDDALNVSFDAPAITVQIGDVWEQTEGGKMGNVGGRHGSNKSGHVEGYYQPSAIGRPRMKLFDEAIFSGWFRVMFFENVQISYYITDFAGTESPLFYNKTLKDFQDALTGTSAAVSYYIPTHFKVNENYENNSSTPTGYYSEKRGGENYIIGFFDGNGNPRALGSSFSVNKPANSSLYMESAYRRVIGGELIDPVDNTGAFKMTDGTVGGTKNDWDVSGYRLEYQAGISATQSAKIMQSHGQSNSANATACSNVSASNMVTNRCIQIQPELFVDHMLVPFDGPFEAEFNATDGYADVIRNVSQNEISWKFLPGVAGGAVSGLALFVVDQKQIEFYRDGYMPCHSMAKEAGVSGLAGSTIDEFVPEVFHHKLKSVSSTDQAGSHSFAGVDLQDRAAVVCPYLNSSSGKLFYNYGVTNHGFHGGDNGCMNCGPSATKLEISLVGNYSQINTDSCVPALVRSVDDSNNPASPGGPVTLNFNTAMANVTFHQHYSDCLGSDPSGSLTFDQQHSSEIVWIKGSSVESGSVTVSGGSLSSGSYAIDVSGTNMAAALNSGTVNVIVPVEPKKHQCVPVYFIILDGSGGIPADGAGRTFYATDGAGSGLFYDTPHQCEFEDGSGSANPSVFFGSYETTKIFFYRNDVDSSAVSIAAVDSPSPVTLYGSYGISSLQDPGLPSRTFTIIHPHPNDHQLRTGFCYPVEIFLETSNGDKSELGAALSYTITTDGNALVTNDSSCSSSLSTSHVGTLPSGKSAENDELYLVPMAPNFSFDVSNNQGLMGESNIQMMADQTKFQLTLQYGQGPGCNNGILRAQLVDSMGGFLDLTGKSYPTGFRINSDNPANAGFDQTSCGGWTSPWTTSVPAAMDYIDLDLYLNSSGTANITIDQAPGIELMSSPFNVSW